MPTSDNRVKLVPMTDSEFADFLATVNPRYAQEKVEAGVWPPEDALRLSEESHQQLLPDGLATKDNYLYAITDAANGVKVGFLWFAVRRDESTPYIYVYQFEIVESFTPELHPGQKATSLLSPFVNVLCWIVIPVSGPGTLFGVMLICSLSLLSNVLKLIVALCSGTSE